MTVQPGGASAEMMSLIESLSDPVILLNLDYVIVGANQAYRDRYAEGDIVRGRHCYEASHHYDAPCDQAGASCVCPRRKAESTGQSQRVVHIHYTRSGKEHVQVSLSPIKNACGDIVLFLERIHALRIANPSESTRGLVGSSPAFLEVLDLVARVAPTETTALLQGETGTGKELVAQAIHAASKRASGPFVAVDCSGLTETLFENELFGHEKGAFTGAATPKVGLIEAADGGTLFLDEIGDIPLAEQVKLLRLIETGTYRRVGGVEPRHADVRLITATHRDLRRMMAEEAFRQDLFYRISAFPIHLPALRERREDIPRLTRSLLTRLQPDRRLRIDQEAMALLERYDFPGNIRELRNILERASLLANNYHIRARHLPAHLHAAVANVVEGDRPADPADSADSEPDTEPALQAAERAALEKALARHPGNRSAVAGALGISERSLYRKLGKFGLLRNRKKTH